MYIYVISNEINGKIYVGMHGGKLTPQDYLRSKFYAACKGANTHLHRAIRKHGENTFSITPLMSVHGISREQLGDLERYFIRCLQSQAPEIGYNMTPGGDGQAKGFSPTQATRQKIREAVTGKPKSAEARQRIRESKLGANNPQFGKPRTKEERHKISTTLQSDVHRERLRNLHLGTTHSEATKQKMRGVHTGIRHTDETRRKLSDIAKAREAAKREATCS